MCHFEWTRILGELRLITVTSTFLPELLEHVSHLPIWRTRTRPQATHTSARSRYERRLRGLQVTSDSEELEQLAVGGLEYFWLLDRKDEEEEEGKEDVGRVLFGLQQEQELDEDDEQELVQELVFEPS